MYWCRRGEAERPDRMVDDVAAHVAEFADAESALLPTTSIERCTRREPLELEPDRGCEYTAAMDPATRGNANRAPATDATLTI